MSELLESLLSHDPWMERGNCVGHMELFFPFPAGMSRSNASQELLDAEEKGRQMCLTCPVLSECYEYARHLPPSTEGTFAGLTKHDRMHGARLFAAPPTPKKVSSCEGCGVEIEHGARFCSMTCHKEHYGN